MKHRIIALGALVLAACELWAGRGAGQEKDGLAAKLRELDARVFPADGEQAKQLPQMLAKAVRARRDLANKEETEAWERLKSKDDWERYRDERLKALRASLGTFPEPPKDLKVRVTRTLHGDGYRIENLVFESRPGLVVTANLYLPADPPNAMAGILIVHSHHNAKTQGELQDMGMTWARLGCMVLVMDQLGHGERRQHPFTDASKSPQAFKPGRQDYYFRYNVANELHLVGESLIGWMVWDLMRGVDLLLARPGIDKDRIILLGSVAGGGDPAAVTAALDRRIAAAVPFNFGGPQPETRFPLPPDAKKTFNYIGGGSWESTRNLRLSARDGFQPWVIVGAIAPRGLIYAHEFAWDRGNDPVWKRLEKIYEWYGARDRLASAAGKGAVTGKAGPENTHCNNIGAIHRRGIYPALKRWFGMPEPDKEYQKRHPPTELLCLTPDAAAAFAPRPVHELAARLGAERAAAARERLAGLAPGERAKRLREDWARLLGKVEPPERAAASDPKISKIGDVVVERFDVVYPQPDEPNIVVPVVLLRPPHDKGTRLPVVVGLAQEGKAALLRQRAEVIAALLEGGAAVCLPDLRGTGESRPGESRGRVSAATSLSASEWMFGRTLLAGRLRDLRLVLTALRGRRDLDGNRVALWGDSFAPVNAAAADAAVPLDAAKLPPQAEPLGGLLALFGALYEPDVRGVYARGGLSGYQELLQSPFFLVPHDAHVPGALTAGDLCDVTAALAPRPVRLEGLVDGVNRRVAADALGKIYAPARAAYRAAGVEKRLTLNPEPAGGGEIAGWLLAQLKGK